MFLDVILGLNERALGWMELFMGNLVFKTGLHNLPLSRKSEQSSNRQEFQIKLNVGILYDWMTVP